MSKFIHDGEQTTPYVFLQWKGTDVCMDFNCDCGASCHFDGYFAYTVKCPHCETIWEMPCFLTPRKADEKTDGVELAKPLEPDEDYSEEALGSDGVTRLVAHPVSGSSAPVTNETTSR